MSWAAQALQALKKIITLEERITVMVDDVKTLSAIIRDMDKRLLKLETKIEIYESLADKSRTRKLPRE